MQRRNFEGWKASLVTGRMGAKLGATRGQPGGNAINFEGGKTSGHWEAGDKAGGKAGGNLGATP